MSMDYVSILKTVAPWIGTAIAGPLGGLALEAAANALGLSDKTTEGLKAAISGVTPEQMLALKTADQQFQLQMQALGFANAEKLAALGVENTKDARAMQIAVRSVVPSVLAVFVTLGFFGLLGGMMAGKLSTQDSAALNLMLGSLSTAWIMIVSFYYGSSSGSERKDEIAAAKKA